MCDRRPDVCLLRQAGPGGTGGGGGFYPHPPAVSGPGGGGGPGGGQPCVFGRRDPASQPGVPGGGVDGSGSGRAGGVGGAVRIWPVYGGKLVLAAPHAVQRLFPHPHVYRLFAPEAGAGLEAAAVYLPEHYRRHGDLGGGQQPAVHPAAVFRRPAVLFQGEPGGTNRGGGGLFLYHDVGGRAAGHLFGRADGQALLGRWNPV